MKQYTLVFAFDKTCENVLLMKVTKETFNTGKINGIGGKVLENETVCNAAFREFTEETGITVPLSGPSQSSYMGIFTDCDNWEVYVYCCILPNIDSNFKYETNEGIVEMYNAMDILRHPDLMYNLRWIIPIAHATLTTNYHYKFLIKEFDIFHQD